jgi:hypothetical protein
MAYNVFKRPMFKRGGSIQGTGIMSHVEPRVKAADGYDFTKTPAYKAASGFTNYGINSAIAGGLDLINVPLNTLSRFFTGYNPGFSGTKQLDLLTGGQFSKQTGYDPEKAYFFGPTSAETGFSQAVKPSEGVRTSGGITSLDQIAKKNQEIAALKAAAKEDDGAGLKEEPKYTESDARGEIEKEADLIKDLLKDQGLEKAELAFLVADALKTPGSISDKLDTAREKGMKIAAGKKKTDRESTLLAYKAYKDKEAAQIKAGEKTSTQKAIDDYTALSTKKNLTEQDKIKLGALEKVIMGSDDSTLKAYAVSSAPLGDILNLQSDIQELQALEKPSEDQLKKLEQRRQELNLKLKLLQSAGVDLNKILQGGLKEGGRVMRAMGDPDPMQASIESTEVPEGNTEMPVKTVNKLSYSELRDRLPREITDDIVTLLANSEQALQDFAYLRTQQDINDFNVKYGVNVVLPPNKA